MGIETELDKAWAWTKLNCCSFGCLADDWIMARIWTVVPLLGLVKAKIDYFRSGTELTHLVVDETLFFVFAPALINLITTCHPPLCGSPEMLFLQPHERTPFPLGIGVLKDEPRPIKNVKSIFI